MRRVVITFELTDFEFERVAELGLSAVIDGKIARGEYNEAEFSDE